MDILAGHNIQLHVGMNCNFIQVVDYIKFDAGSWRRKKWQTSEYWNG